MALMTFKPTSPGRRAMTVADFAVSVALPHAEKIRLPLDGFKNIARWQSHLEELPGWREPFPQVKAAA